MSAIRLTPQEDDDRALIFRVQHIVAGAVRYVRPGYAHVVKIDGWFGARWRGFAGHVGGRDLHVEDRLAKPPFSPNRVVSEVGYRRRGSEFIRANSLALYESRNARSTDAPSYLDELVASGIFIWYSGNTLKQDRASLMVYEVKRGEEQRGWYAELEQRDGVWSISSAIGTSVNELSELETAYGDRLERLDLEDEKPDVVRHAWQQALDAAYSANVAQAAVLIDTYEKAHPDDVHVRLLRARNLGQRRLLERAEEEFVAIEFHSSSDKWRAVWLEEWAAFREIRSDYAGSERAYRELASLKPDETYAWILLGACLARQGKLQEAETVHSHATELRGNPDEAFLNLGYVLRCLGRFEDATLAFQSALKLCSDYPEASQALADVQAALELRSTP